MEITRKDIGYTVYSRLEEALRSWVSENLHRYGEEWYTHVPTGVLDKVLKKSGNSSVSDFDDPIELLEETDLPDIAEIVCFKNQFSFFVDSSLFSQKEFQNSIGNIYTLRCQIAHVKKNFSAIDLDFLIELSHTFIPLLQQHADEVSQTLKCLKTSPSSVVIHIPSEFLLDGEFSTPYLHNLPPSDYDPDGGFIGRKDDLQKIRRLILSDLDRVITISGAGGVGKTALAHRFCSSLIQQQDLPFDAIVWISAKEEKLTLTGIEPIEPTIRNYEEVLDSILSVYGWYKSVEADLTSKEEDVDIILHACDKGTLLIVDNLETIQDVRIFEFIKDIPRPNKVLITSRMGLGEVERRYPLKELSKTDAITLIRTVAREKGVENLAKLNDDILYKYAVRMSSYPLAIKWVVGQVALGKDIDRLINDLASTSGDIARFCFEHIYDNLLSKNAKTVLLCLAISDSSLTRGVLTHISGLQPDQLDEALRQLTLASLVIPEQEKGEDDSIVTSYSLLPLTLGYLKGKAVSQAELWRTIQSRMELVSLQIEKASTAGKYYRYALQDLGATTDDEKIAASWALAAYQRHQMGDYNGAIDAFNRAVEIAPNFSRLFRNWAVVESAENYFERAEELMKKAVSLNENDPALWFTWGNIEKRRGRLDDSRRYFQKALSLSPNDGAVLGGLGEVEKRKGNHETAGQYFQSALRISPDVQGYKHEVITYTAIADNLRRWADQLQKDKRIDLAIEKAEEAYQTISKVLRMSVSDKRARDTYNEIAYTLGMLITERDDINAALPYFEKVIVPRPTRMKEKKTNSIVCYFVAKKLLQAGQESKAKEYCILGEKSGLRTPQNRELYKTLRNELFEQKYRGIIYRIVQDSGYGFINCDDFPNQGIFFHLSQVAPRISNEEFNCLEGQNVSFVFETTEKGPQALNVRVL